MSLKQIMGNAYKEGITVEEIVAFFEGNSKIVNLGLGGYVSKEKFDEIKGKYDTLVESTKDYEDIKTKYDGLVAKQTKDGEIAIINKYVNPDYAEFVHYQMSLNKTLGDGLEEAVKKYVGENKQYGIVKEKNPVSKVVKTFTEPGTGNKPTNNPNDTINNAIRNAFGRVQQS